jgi:hypothetical protein
MSTVRPRPSEPRRPATRGFRPELTALEDRTMPAVQVLRSFAGLTAQQSDGPNGTNLFVPPDTTAAAGPNHVVMGVNNAVAIYNKFTGQRLQFQSASSFYGLNIPNADLFDPVVQYDASVGRFYVIWLAVNDAASTSQLVIAVSNTSNPLQGFTERVAINVRQTNTAGTNLWADFPQVGFNREALVVSMNMFTLPSAQNPQFDHVQIRSIRKSTLLDRNPNTIQTFFNDRSAANFCMAPAVMHNAPANGPMFFAQAIGNNQIRVTRATNILSNNATFVDSDVAVNTYAVPPNAPQVGGTQLNTADFRILNAEWRANQLVATHIAGVGGEATARWYQFNVTGTTPTVVQQGEVDPGVGFHTYMPSIAIAPGGFIAMTYMQSSATTTMSMFATGRRPSDPLGTMPNNTLIRLGSQTYSAFDGTPFRVGDYSATTIDPQNGTFWVANEFATSAASDNWGTWIANVRVPGQRIVPVPPGPQPLVFPGRFVRNYNEQNETSDRAASLGTVTRGVNSMPGLSINRNALGLPDYDWFKFRIQRRGLLQVMNIITSGQQLEMSLWRRRGNQLVLIGRAVTNNGGFSRLIARVALGEEIYVGVQGWQVGPGQSTVGAYNMRYYLT